MLLLDLDLLLQLSWLLLPELRVLYQSKMSLELTDNPSQVKGERYLDRTHLLLGCLLIIKLLLVQ